jgi:putative transposase
MEQLSLLGLNQGIDGIMLSPTLVCKEFITLCYCRVSSPKQRDDLNRQVEFMQSKYPEAETLFFAMRDQSSKTSAAASIISVKGLKPYWNAQCKVISSKLWLPIKTVLQDLDSTSSNGLLNVALEKSWFSSRLIYPQNRRSQQTYSAFFTSQGSECMDLETIKAKSVKLYPIQKQKRTFKKWHDCSRYTFNQTIDYIRSCVNFSPSWMDIKKDLLKRLPEWCDEVPFQIKGIAVKEAHQAFWKAKGHPRFRSRKAPMQSCYIPKSAIKNTGIYPRVSGKGLRLSEFLPESPLDSRLIYQYNEWFLSVPHKTTTHVAESQGRVVALDPGVRTFQSFYSESVAGHIGYDDFGRIQRLCFHLDDLISRTSKATGKAKREMKKAQTRIRKKIKNLTKEIHFKTARFLVDNFDVILLPTFETSQMVGKSYRKLRSKTVRAMLTWAHYQFKMRLKNKALELGKKVIDVCEAYTSKTVSWTGKVKKVGGSRVIRSGGITLDRDLNGARGIFVRSLVDSPTLMGAIVNVC